METKILEKTVRGGNILAKLAEVVQDGRASFKVYINTTSGEADRVVSFDNYAHAKDLFDAVSYDLVNMYNRYYFQSK